MRHRALVLTTAVVLSSTLAPARAAEPPVTQRLAVDVHFLASDSLEGRAAGTAGGRIAARYVADRFAALGLRPAGDDGGYLQSFSFISGVHAGPANRLAFTADGTEHAAVADEDFRPLAFSASGSADGEVVFAGYGISAPDLGYDDYAGLDAEGKIVLVLRHSPDGDDPSSRFQPYMALRRKASEARQHGAAAVLVATGPEKGDSEAPVKLAFDASFGDAGLPVLSISTSLAESLFAGQGFTLGDLQSRIGERDEPASRPLGVRASLAADVIQERATTANVVALLPGADPALANQVVVIGAHYDHLGYGGPDSGSLTPDEHAVHNGADDNASGVAGMLETARRLAARPPARTVLFAAFAAEERGLLGSSHLAQNLPVDQGALVAMINMDMIGRAKRGPAVTVGGYGTAAEWPDIVEAVNADHHLKIATDKGGFGASDHSSFYSLDVPVLFLFTGAHGDYHKPTDDAERLDYGRMAEIVGFVADLARTVADRPEPPTFQRVADEGTGGRRSYKVRTGVIPEFGYEGEGFKISGVAGGSPAEKAGLAGGDVVVRFGDREIRNIYDYMYALGDHEPGQTVDVVVLRDGERLTFPITLEPGRGRG